MLFVVCCLRVVSRRLLLNGVCVLCVVWRFGMCCLSFVVVCGSVLFGVCCL